ncbi:hypothetical protein Hanom_Chr05g00416391 [Helianthus anomalus]
MLHSIPRPILIAQALPFLPHKAFINPTQWAFIIKVTLKPTFNIRTLVFIIETLPEPIRITWAMAFIIVTQPSRKGSGPGPSQF